MTRKKAEQQTILDLGWSLGDDRVGAYYRRDGIRLSLYKQGLDGKWVEREDGSCPYLPCWLVQIPNWHGQGHRNSNFVVAMSYRTFYLGCELSILQAIAEVDRRWPAPPWMMSPEES